MKNIRKLVMLFIGLFALILPGCGGGDTTANPFNVELPQEGAGVFEDETNYLNYCASPRVGTNPLTGIDYPDIQGTTLSENNWLRSWSNNTYLWYNEIIDRNPALYSTAAYFDLLKTNATTVSGTPKDQFHFTYPTEVWEQLSQAGVSAGYGAEWAIISGSPPREIRVAFTEPGSPATTASIARGTEILKVDGVVVYNSPDIDTLNNGLFPAGTGEMHTFEVRDLSGSVSTVNMTSESVTSTPVQNVKTITTPTGTVGYILFNSHIATAEKGLYDAVTTLSSAGINDLVLDLRYNGGGYLYIASQLAYMIADSTTATSGKIFEDLVFNDKHPTVDPVTGSPLAPTPFYNVTSPYSSLPADLPLPTLNLNLKRVFILSQGGTCSASEAIINGLRGIDVEVVLIGSTTCGKPYGFYATPNCGTSYFTIQFKGENNKGFSSYTDGFTPANTVGAIGEKIPGCSVADDFLHSLGDPAEGQLAAALNYRNSGALGCPAPSGSAVSAYSTTSMAKSGSLFKSEINRPRTMLGRIPSLGR